MRLLYAIVFFFVVLLLKKKNAEQVKKNGTASLAIPLQTSEFASGEMVRNAFE